MNILYLPEHHKTEEDYVNFTVCMTPLLGDDHFIRMRLIEMVEMSMIFGAQRFVFYNITTKPDSPVMEAIKYYHTRGVMTIVQWPWPFPIHRKYTNHNGQHEAQMDCVLRNLYRSKYVAYFDIDEILVPRSTDNWSDLFALPKLNNPCGLEFRNTFFYTHFDDDENMASDPLVRSPLYSIFSLLKTKRTTAVWPPGKRSKSLAIAKNVRLPQVHRVYCNGTQTKVLSPEDGLLHHYRSARVIDYSQRPFVTDRYMHRFNQTIKDNIWKVMRNLQHI